MNQKTLGSPAANAVMENEPGATRQAVLQNSVAPTLKRGRTDHAVAVAYSRKGWGKFHSRADWESSVLRYHGAFTLYDKTTTTTKT